MRVLETLSEAVPAAGSARRCSRDAGAAARIAAPEAAAPWSGSRPATPPDRRGRAVAVVAFPAIAAGRDALPRMTDGPFYPSPSYRARALDWDADLTVVGGRDPDGKPRPRAAGEHLDLLRHGPGRRRPSDRRRRRSRSGSATRSAAIGTRAAPAPGSTPASRASAAPAATPAAATGSAPSGRCPTPAARRTSTSSCGTRRSASSPRSCSSPAIPATPATSSIASLSDADREAVEMRPVRAPAGSPVMWQVERSLIVG